MRVISGTARGTKLETIEGLNTRPTTDRVKEAMFSMIHHELYDAEVLDLFAGSGSLGIESASRGAKNVTLVENSKKCIEIIKKNVQKTRLDDKIIVVNKQVENFINIIEQSFDFIIMDPPYLKGFIEPIMQTIFNRNLLKEGGVVVVEHESGDMLKQKYGNIELYKNKKYGRTCLSIYRRIDD